jgi:hypothetical protein
MHTCNTPVSKTRRFIFFDEIGSPEYNGLMQYVFVLRIFPYNLYNRIPIFRKLNSIVDMSGVDDEMIMNNSGTADDTLTLFLNQETVCLHVNRMGIN